MPKSTNITKAVIIIDTADSTQCESLLLHPVTAAIARRHFSWRQVLQYWLYYNFGCKFSEAIAGERLGEILTNDTIYIVGSVTIWKDVCSCSCVVM